MQTTIEVNISHQSRDQIAMWYHKLEQIKSLIPATSLDAQSKSKNQMRRKLTKPSVMKSVRSVFRLDDQINQLLFSVSDLIWLRENVCHQDGTRTNGIDMDIDFLKLWQDLLYASVQILALMNQSVRRYFTQQT